jgi:hypothetical protein
MEDAITPTATRRQHSLLSPNVFFLVLAVLAIGFTGFDVALQGPLTSSAAEIFVVRPAERDWGFHAEWKEHEATESLLTVVEVTAGGPFDLAGIRRGFAFAPRKSATGGPRFGGPYYVFAGGTRNVRIRMLPEPDNGWREQAYDITR